MIADTTFLLLYYRPDLREAILLALKQISEKGISKALESQVRGQQS